MRSDVGRVRSRNEDRVHCDTNLRLLAIADGMGGHAAGDVASTLAIETVCAHLHRPAEPYDGAALRLQAAISAANRAIHACAQHTERLGMGTTIVATSFDAANIVVAHVGDSRLYRLRNGQLQSLTRDHSWVQDMIDRGLYSERHARSSPRRNQLLRALGATADVEIDVAIHALRTGDRYLLCSDGLTGMVTDDCIAMLLRETPQIDACVQRLIEVANEYGGRDNVTVALADVR